MPSPSTPLAAALLLMAAAASLSARTLVHCGTLIDGLTDAPKKEMTVIVDGDKFVGVQAGYAAPAAGDKVIDLKAATVTPGWIDCHVHLTGQSSPTSYTDGFYLNTGDFALRGALYAKRTLLAGFTTVRDCGSPDNLGISLRKAIAAARQG